MCLKCFPLSGPQDRSKQKSMWGLTRGRLEPVHWTDNKCHIRWQAATKCHHVSRGPSLPVPSSSAVALKASDWKTLPRHFCTAVNDGKEHKCAFYPPAPPVISQISVNIWDKPAYIPKLCGPCCDGKRAGRKTRQRRTESSVVNLVRTKAWGKQRNNNITFQKREHNRAGLQK